MNALVTGAGGFIGHHLVNRLKAEGQWVRGVDLKPPAFEKTRADEFTVSDLRDYDNCLVASRGIDDVYHLAADMGGIGYITENRAHVARHNVLMDAHILEAARASGVRRLFYSSSACVYPDFLQSDSAPRLLREEDAIPAAPEEGYGWEKLFAERLCTYYGEEFGIEMRIARLHNIYGPLGEYRGGREKAPAALCRKAAASSEGGNIEVWGDGFQTRSFCYIDDCIEGIRRIMETTCSETSCSITVNLGSEELVTVNELAGIVCLAAGKHLRLVHDLTRPQGVRGRSSDNSLLRNRVGWEPSISLREGIRRTYEWIAAEMARGGARPSEDASSTHSSR